MARKHRRPVAAADMDLPLSGPDRAARVCAMFAGIVPCYDLMNRLMTGAQDRRWRRATAAAVHPAGGCLLDLATGTGDLAIELAAQGARRVVGADFCAPMLAAAAPKLRRAGLANVELVLADACALPFADASFDGVTSGFLLRNVADLPGCLSEMRRVLRPGGHVAALDLSPRPPGLVTSLFAAYVRHVVPWVGGMVSGDPRAYRYLPASLDPFPDADRLASLFRAAGFEDVRYIRVGFGTVAIHSGRAGAG